MSLISGKYWTGDPKIKPEAWGPVEDVQRSIRMNAEREGIPNPYYYFPNWEMAGSVPMDLMGNVSFSRTDGDWTNQWERGQLYVDGSYDNPDVLYSSAGHSVKGKNVTVIIGAKLISRNDIYYFYHDYSGKILIKLSSGLLVNVKGTADHGHTNNNLPYTIGDYISCGFIMNWSANSMYAHANGVVDTNSTQVNTGFNNADSYKDYIKIGGVENTSHYAEGYYDYFLRFETDLNSSQIATLSDNPYILLQRQPERTYFIPDDVILYPTISYPEDDSINVSQPITFSWSSLTEATGYQLQVADTEAKLDTDPAVDTTTTAPTTTKEVSGLDPSTTYYARVRAQTA